MRVRWRRSGRRRGTAVVEMALILPLFMMLVLGQIESMRLGMVSQLLTTAAREGCRVAVVNHSDATQVEQRVKEVLTGSGITPKTLTITPTNWDRSAGGTPITVAVSVPYKDVSWLPVPYYLKTATVSATATMSNERP